MEKYIAKDIESANNHICNTYGNYTTSNYQITSGVQEKQISEKYIVKTYEGECCCGQCIKVSVEDYENDDRIAEYTVCESCYNEEGRDAEASWSGVIPL